MLDWNHDDQDIYQAPSNPPEDSEDDTPIYLTPEEEDALLESVREALVQAARTHGFASPAEFVRWMSNRATAAEHIDLPDCIYTRTTVGRVGRQYKRKFRHY